MKNKSWKASIGAKEIVCINAMPFIKKGEYVYLTRNINSPEIKSLSKIGNILRRLPFFKNKYPYNAVIGKANNQSIRQGGEVKVDILHGIKIIQHLKVSEIEIKNRLKRMKPEEKVSLINKIKKIEIKKFVEKIKKSQKKIKKKKKKK